MNQRFRPLTCFFTLAMLAALSTDATALARHKQIQHARKPHEATGARHHNNAALRKRGHAAHVAAARRKSAPSDDAAAAPPLSGDLAAVKNAIDLVRKAKTGEATVVEKTIGDPAAQKLVEWFILRHPDADAKFGRYAAFIADNPGWPGMGLMRRRAEARLWQERSDAATVHSFTGDQPASAKGRLALARVLLAEGDRDGAGRWVREAWRSEELSERSETEAFEMFRDLLTREDHRARMDKRIGAKDFSGAKRAAQRLGSDELSIVKACAAVTANATKALDLLDAVATEARQDLGYALCRIHWMLRHDRIEDATRLMLAAAPETMALQDTDEWWRERRILARKLLDLGKFQTAYQVVRDAACRPVKITGRISISCPAGSRCATSMIPRRARAISPISTTDRPIRSCWRGRTTGEAASPRRSARRTRCAPAMKLPRATPPPITDSLRAPNSALTELSCGRRCPPIRLTIAALSDERVRAADMLYALGERDVVVSFVADLAEQSVDVAALVALGELTGRRNDARAMLEIGKTALARGLALDLYAFPTIGIPQHSPIGPEIDRSVIYSVARTESAFDQRDKSPANAVGLMQVTPEAARDTAKRFGVAYDWDRMVSDPVYNTQMGAAELSALLKEYSGSHIMTFAGYNAGRGRVREWVKQYGDPRDPNVDAIDWVERIPFAETRNYVQRVMENLQVYRVRFDAGASVMSKSPDQHQGAAALEVNAAPPQ